MVQREAASSSSLITRALNLVRDCSPIGSSILWWISSQFSSCFVAEVLSGFIPSEIKLRQEAVSELTVSENPSLSLLKALLHKLPDLEKKLSSVYHKKVMK